MNGITDELFGHFPFKKLVKWTNFFKKGQSCLKIFKKN